jgi:two-component system, sensor histidine kinase
MLKNDTVRTVFIALAVLLMLHAGTHISILFKQSYSTSEIYLPSALSLIFIYWFGPRIVLPLAYLNSAATSYLWGHSIDQWPKWFLYGLPEIVYPLVSWYLFSKLCKGKYWLPDLRNTILFLSFGIFIPAICEGIALQSVMLMAGLTTIADYWRNVFGNVLSEFTTTFIVTFPLIYHATPLLAKWRLVQGSDIDIRSPATFTRRQIIELSVIFLLLAILMFHFDFSSYWYLYGFISFFVGMRFGFGPVIATNLLIMIIAYFIPRFFLISINTEPEPEELNNFFVAANCMFVFAVLNSRVISDLKLTETALKVQYSKLERTNKELDRFIYSVSHDLTAPLKSILGLVKIGRLTNDELELKLYMEKIEKSVLKLEAFIHQAFDYSRNNRLKETREPFNLRELCDEIIENFKLSPEATEIDFQFALKVNEVVHDRSRLKIILNNLISNAIKYQIQRPEQKSYIKVSSYSRDSTLYISVEDNGQGIQADQIEKVFQMFYRGSDRSWGAGLGLYIAKETASALQGHLTLTSAYGTGSTFTVALPIKTIP